jgi:hypothetical protein
MFSIDWDKDSGVRFNSQEIFNIQYQIIQKAYNFLIDNLSELNKNSIICPNEMNCAKV